MAKKSVATAVTPAESDDLAALVVQTKRIADVLEQYCSPYPKLTICGHVSLEGFYCIRGPNHAGYPHTNVNVQPPKVWADSSKSETPTQLSRVECGECGMIDTHEVDCPTGAKALAALARAGISVPVGAPEAPPLPAAAATPSGVTSAQDVAVAAAPTLAHGIETAKAGGHGQDVATLVSERERLSLALGDDLAALVAPLGDATQDPGVALAVKKRAVEVLGSEAAFASARSACGIKAGRCPNGAELRKFSLEALAPKVATL